MLNHSAVAVTMWRSDTLQPVYQRFRFHVRGSPDPALQPYFQRYVVYCSYEEALSAYRKWVAANNQQGGCVQTSLQADKGRIVVSIFQSGSSRMLAASSFSWAIAGRPWTPEPISVTTVAEAKEYAWSWYHRLFSTDADTELADANWPTSATPSDSTMNVLDETEDDDEDVLTTLPTHITLTELPDTLAELPKHWSELTPLQRGWRPLDYGDLIEVRADVLANERIFHQLTAVDTNLVGLVLNTVPSLPAMPMTVQATADAGVLGVLKTGVLELARAAACGGLGVCDDFLQLMTGPTALRPLVAADTVKLGLFLPNPFTEVSLQNTSTQQSLTIKQLRLALSSVSSSDINADDGTFITALNPIVADTDEMDSTRAEYTSLCKSTMSLALATGAKAFVVFGSAARIRWLAHAEELAGVDSAETTYSNDDRVWSTWLEMDGGRRVRVVYSPHPCNTHKLLEVTLAIRAARADAAFHVDKLAIDELERRVDESSMVKLLSVDLVHADATSVGWQVDGDGRFVLGNGVLTHNCPMIQTASVGVGISGREGMQAARASDFSISQFSHLRRLLLVHGRWSYVRTAWIAQYCLYKSLIIALVQLAFAFVSRFSGASFFDSFSIMSYNLFYTSVLGVFYLFEQDLSADTLLRRPQLYATTRERHNYTVTTLMCWLCRSVYQSVFVSIVTFNTWLGTTAVRGLGDSNQLAIALIAYSSIVVVQCCTLYMEMTFIVIWVHVIVAATVVGFLVINLLVSASPGMEAYSVYVGVLGDPVYWLTVLLCVAGCVLPVVGVKYWWRTELPSQVDIAQQEEMADSTSKRQSDALSHSQPTTTLLRLHLLTLCFSLSFRRTTSGAGLLSGSSHPSYATGNTSTSTHSTLPTTKQLLNTIKRTRKARKQRTDKRESRKRLIAHDNEADEENSVQMYDNSSESKGEEDEKGHVIRLDGDDEGGEEEEVAMGDDSLTSVDMDESRLHEVKDEYGDEEDEEEEEEEEEKKGGRR